MKFLQITVLITLLFSGVALYLAIPTPKILQCSVVMFDIMEGKLSRDGKIVPMIISQQRMFCIEVDKGDPL